MRCADKPHTLYRLFDTSGSLLYVGCSVNPRARLAQHRCRQPWGKTIASMTEETHPDGPSARLAEAAAIAAERPLFNIQLHPVNKGARVECLSGPMTARVLAALSGVDGLLLIGVMHLVRAVGDPSVEQALADLIASGDVVAVRGDRGWRRGELLYSLSSMAAVA